MSSFPLHCEHDRVLDLDPARTALIWDSPVTNTHNVRISYRQLLDDVQTLAGVLRGLGIEKGDRVLVYSERLPPFLYSRRTHA